MYIIYIIMLQAAFTILLLIPIVNICNSYLVYIVKLLEFDNIVTI